MTKKILAIVLTLAMVLSLAACGAKKTEEPAPEAETPVEEVKESETPAETPAEVPAETPAEKPAETKPAEAKPAETKPAETKPAETKPAETPAEKPAETKPAETPAASEKTVNIKFTLKNKEELGSVKSMKFVPSGKSADSYSNALSAPVKGVTVVEATIVAADYYDIVIVFEQGGTKTLKGVPAAFDKISLKNGGASIANHAAGVDYVTSKSGVECNSDKFKFQ